MARKKRRSRFDREAVLRHAAHHHPNCPVEIVALFADDISTREWEPPLTLGQAFGIKATNHVRHKMTDYERLLRIPGLTRDEARLIVSFDVRAILAGWRTELPPKRGPRTELGDDLPHSLDQGPTGG